MEKAKQVIDEFNKARDWSKFHTPENLAKSISIEAGELLECFQWNNEYDRQELIEELADVQAYCIILAEKIENDVNSSTSFIDRVSKILYESLLFRKNSDLIKTIIKEISKSNTAECISFLKFYDDEIVSYIEEKIRQEIQNKTIKKCDAHLTAFIIYKVYSSILFEYDREIDEERVTKEVTNILKDGLLN